MIRFKTCEVMQYFEYYDTDNIDVIRERIESLTNLKTYAFIVHDKDVREDGQLKPKHFHCVLTFKDTTTSSCVAKVLKVEEQYINKIRTTTKSAELYLIHKNNPEKFQYDPKCVYANFDYIEKYDGVEPLQNMKEIAIKIEQGIIKPFNIIDYVGVNEYAKHKTYINRCFEYRNKSMLGVNRSMKCIFITGASGTGKTTLAKNIAISLGYSMYISSGGNNPLDDYEGQDCIILDDLRDSNYRLSDFLKLTDNNTNSLVGCRFYNKSIAECRLLIVTSIKTIEDFYKSAINEEKEPQVQLFRRFTEYYKLTLDTLEMYNYNPETRDYSLNTKCINPSAINYNKEMNKQFTNNIIDALKLQKFDSPSNKIEDTDLPF